MAQQQMLFGNLQKGKTYLAGVLSNPDTGLEWLSNAAGPQLIYTTDSNENVRIATAKAELKAIIEAAGYGLTGLVAQLNAMFSWSYPTLDDIVASDTAMSAIAASEEAVGSIAKVEPAVDAITKSALALNRIAKGGCANKLIASTHNATFRDQALETCINGTTYFTNAPVAAQNVSTSVGVSSAITFYHNIATNAWAQQAPTQTQNAIYFPKRWSGGANSGSSGLAGYIGVYYNATYETFRMSSTTPVGAYDVAKFGFGALALMLRNQNTSSIAAGVSSIAAWSGTSSAEGVAFLAI